MEDYLKLKTEMTQLRAEMGKKALEAFKEGAKALFAKYPMLKMFSWTQYTPYFMDGEPCVFDSNVNWPTINEEEVSSYEVKSLKEEFGTSDRLAMLTKYGIAEEQFKNQEHHLIGVFAFLFAFDSEAYLSMFGDHVKVTVTATETKVEEYNHE